MAFDPTQPYATYTNDVGNIYFFQGGVYYDSNNNAVSPLPATLPPSTGVVPVPQKPYASLPAASTVAVGTQYRATDIGIAPGMMLVSDGTHWLPDGAQVLARSAVGINTPADTNEDILATITIPANLLGASGGLRVDAAFSMTNNANNKIMKIRFGGIGGNPMANLTNASVANSPLITGFARNAGATNSQTLTGFQAGATLSVNTGSVDTTAATTVVITGQKAVSGDTLTLRLYEVLLVP